MVNDVVLLNKKASFTEVK